MILDLFRKDIEFDNIQGYDDIMWACRLSELIGHKNFQELQEEDIQKVAAFYNKGEIESDRKHHWIGTYNQAQIHITKFLKFVFYPNIFHKKRPKPAFLANYPLASNKGVGTFLLFLNTTLVHFVLI